MLIDLQLHSTYSDGYKTPTEVADIIAERGIKIAALTDHNTVSGLDEFSQACQGRGIKTLPGIELYAKMHQWRFNLLWYNFDPADPDLHDLLRDSQRRRRRQIRNILRELKGRGWNLDPDKIVDRYNHYVPVNRVVDDFCRGRGNMERIKRELELKQPREGHVIQEYFRNKKYGILKNSYIDIDRIKELKEKIGGQLILCHPGKNNRIDLRFWRVLKEHGVDGVEKLSPHHTYNAVVYIQHLARILNWIEAGGSDFHKFEGRGHPVQSSWQYFRVDSELLRGVDKIIKQAK